MRNMDQVIEVLNNLSQLSMTLLENSKQAIVYIRGNNLGDLSVKLLGNHGKATLILSGTVLIIYFTYK
jgi:hypothetical protein